MAAEGVGLLTLASFSASMRVLNDSVIVPLNRGLLRPLMREYEGYTVTVEASHSCLYGTGEVA